MRPALEPILIECLDALENGEKLDLILQRYPEYADELRPYLETAVQLQQLPIQPTLAAQRASKQTFLAQAAEMKAAPVVPFWKNWAQGLRLATALALFLVLFLAGFTYTAATAVPGDLLYDSKLFIENARLQVAAPLQKIELVEQFNQERIAEINQLLAAGREEEVTFTGFITTVVDDNTLIIADLTVLLSAESVVEGNVAVGYFAEVNGRTQNDAVFASHIIIASPPSEETPEPEPTQTATPQFTATATHTHTNTPTVTLTATSTTTSTPTPTVTATPTASLTPVPTQTITPIPTVVPATATPDDDDNENNENEDDNSNDDDSEDDNSDNDSEDDSNDNDSNDNDSEDDSIDNDVDNDDDSNENNSND